MSPKFRIAAIYVACLLVAVGAAALLSPSIRGFFLGRQSPVPVLLNEEDESVPAAVTSTPEDFGSLPQDTTALGGYNVLIADRGNNRLIEVTPEKQIVWEYDFNLPSAGLGADDSFFADDGKTVIVNLENYHVLQLIDYATKKVTWDYGTPGVPGSKPGQLNTPDDAYKIPNGDVTVADIKNCRVIEIAPDKSIVRQYGETGKCGSQDGLLDKPNGDTPIPGGHTLISNIVSRSLIELDQDWKKIFSMPLPVSYPSDPQLTRAGNILISDYSNPGKIVEVSRDGKIVWQFAFTQGDRRLNHPSLAIELPNGNIMSNDDGNHRVIVIDKKTNQIVWQYGITGKPGRGLGQLNTPDGMDIIMRPAATSTSATPSPNVVMYTVGQVSRNPLRFQNTHVQMKGYLLKSEGSYVIISDEAGGRIGRFDLPVTGNGISNLQTKTQYVFSGVLVNGGLTASNGNLYHLELSDVPAPSGK